MLDQCHNIEAKICPPQILSQRSTDSPRIVRRAPPSTRDAIRRAPIWHAQNQSHRADAATSVLAQPNLTADRERLDPRPNAGVRDCNAPPKISASDAEALRRAE
jgi:hypothetical protein